MSKQTEKNIVHIVDDDEAVRDAISLLLDSVGITNKTYANAQIFLQAFSAAGAISTPACIVLDIRMPGINGLECQRQLYDLDCKLPIIFITGHGDVPMAVEAMKRGAAEFIQKPFRDQDLLDRIQESLEISEKRAEVNKKIKAAKDRLSALTEREKEVLDKIIEGKANKVIALDLHLSQRTVEIHRARVMEKMKAKSLAELIKMVVAGELKL